MTASSRRVPRGGTLFIVPVGLVLLILTGVACAGCGFREPPYKAELRTFEERLAKRDAVSCIQSWLALRPSGSDWLSRNKWPDCLDELNAAGVHVSDDGGVLVTFVRDRRFVAMMGPTLRVYPPGHRPVLDVHVPTQDTPGYLGTFGPDAYVSFSER
jgi:hypothetical protein